MSSRNRKNKLAWTERLGGRRSECREKIQHGGQQRRRDWNEPRRDQRDAGRNTEYHLSASNREPDLKQDILELKSALNASRTVTDNLKTQLRKAEKANDILKEELESTRNKLNDQIEESNRLDEIYDELEQ